MPTNKPDFNIADGNVGPVYKEGSPLAFVKGIQSNTWFYAPRAARIAKSDIESISPIFEEQAPTVSDTKSTSPIFEEQAPTVPGPLSPTEPMQPHDAAWYLKQQGLSDPSEIGTRKTVKGGVNSTFQGALTFNAGVKTSRPWELSTWYQDGYALVDYTVTIVKKVGKSSRSGYNTSFLNKGGSFSQIEEETGSKFKAAIKLAVSAGDIKVSKDLDFEYQRYLKRAVEIKAQGDTFTLELWSNGGLFAKAGIEVEVNFVLEKQKL